MISKVQTSTREKSKGRPLKEFDDLTDRTKRRRSQDLVKGHSPAELSYATCMSLRASGSSEAASVIKKLSTKSSSELQKVKKAIDVDLNPRKEISGDVALSDLVEGKMTRKTYRLIRKREVENNACVYPSYHKVEAAKSRCYPPGIKVTETTAEVPLQSLLNHRTSRILSAQSLVINSLPQEQIKTLQLFVKWGFDGSSEQSQYKQKFDDESASDSHMLLTSLSPLRLTSSEDENFGIWQNPKPSSPRFCSPIKIEFIRETTASTLRENKYVEDQIAKLVPFETIIDGKEVTVTFKLLFTMIDGKVRNTITITKSNMRCYLCGATSSKFNNLEQVRVLPVDKKNLEYGLATLHAWIHFMEYFVHIGYKKDNKKWQARSVKQKESAESRKLAIQKGFKTRIGLDIDKPKPGGSGTSNDGNTARRFFEKSSVSAEILGVEVELLNRAHIIMQVLSCGFAVNVDLFQNYCIETARLLVKTYPWYYMPTSIHEILIHGYLVIEWAPLPIGSLSEEAQESRNKDIKKYRENYSRKNSRKNTMMDVMYWLLVSSDPLISSLRLTPPKKSPILSSEAIKLLLPAYASMADEPSDQSDVSSEDGSYMSD